MEKKIIGKICADCGQFMNDTFTNARGDEYCRCANCGNAELIRPATSSVPDSAPNSELQKTLIERGNRYGEFHSQAAVTQALKYVMQHNPNIEGVWDLLTGSQREALEMIAHKISCILNGDPNYRDSWIDIAGYAQLVADELKD